MLVFQLAAEEEESLSSTAGGRENGPCHKLMAVHPFAQRYPLLKQKSEMRSHKFLLGYWIKYK